MDGRSSTHARALHAQAAALQFAGERARYQRLARLYATTPLTLAEIAQREGVSKDTVRTACRRLLDPALYRELRRQKRSARMMGNARARGRIPSARFMERVRDRWGEKNPAWKGDAASLNAARTRAQRRFPITGDCETCGAPAEVRHHRDENPLNNVATNISFLCRACHMNHHLHAKA